MLLLIVLCVNDPQVFMKGWWPAWGNIKRPNQIFELQVAFKDGDDVTSMLPLYLGFFFVRELDE